MVCAEFVVYIYNILQIRHSPKSIYGLKSNFNDILDVKNEMIPIQKIIHTPHHKVKRDSIEPYNDIIEVDNIDIEPLIKKTTSTKKISKTRPKN